MVDNLEAISSSCVMTQSLKKARPSTSETDELLLECTLLNCNKKFKHISGLNYHQSHAHKKSLVDESKPDGGKLDGGLEAPLPTDTGKSEVTHEENDDCGVESSSAKDLSADVVVPAAKEDLAGSRAQINCVDTPVCLDVTLPASLSITTSCTSGAPVVDTCTSGPGLDGKLPLKVKESHVSPPPRPTKEPSSESEQSSVSTAGLARPPSMRQLPQDTKSKDGGKYSRASDADKSHVADTMVSGSPAPSGLSSVLSLKPSSSCQKPLPSASDDKEGKSCVISSTEGHQSQSETPTGSLSTSAVTVVSSSASSGFPISSDNKSPNYSDISDSAEFLGQADHGASGQQQQGKDGDLKKHQRPMLESRQQKSKHETTGSQSHSSSSTSGVSTLHSSVPLSNGQPGNDPVRQQRMKESEPPAKETMDCSLASSYSKPTSPEEKPSISRTAYHADTESDAQAKEHRLWLENLHHHHQHHHQNSAIASSMAMASSAAAAMNMMPYGYGLDQAAYHLQFLSQNPETRSHYERWLMEQSHYLQQQQNHHHHQQQQRCFNKMMQAEAESGPSSDSKPVDMTSKGQIHPSNDSAPRLAPPFAGKPKTGIKPDGKPSDGGKSLYKSTLDDWMSRRDSAVPSSNGIADSCGDLRKTTAQPSGRNNASKEKSDSIRPEQLHKGKDALWERNERVATNKSSGVSQETGSPDLSSSHLPPISKASNPVGNISPYSPGNASGLLKNFIQDPSHQSLIGYNVAASFMDMSEASSISPNSKFLDLDSKQVVTGSNLRRSGDGRHTLDVLRYQSAMYGKQPTAEHLGSNGPKHNRSTLSKDFLEEPGHAKDGKGSPSGHSSPLTLRHLHTHHHTHVVGAAYPLYGSYNGKHEHIGDS